MTSRGSLVLSLNCLLTSSATAGMLFLSDAQVDSIVGVAIDADFDEFRIPDHRWHSTGLSIDGAAHSDSDKRPTSLHRTSDYSGGAIGTANWWRDSDHRAQTFRILVSLRGERARARETDAPESDLDPTLEQKVRRRFTDASEQWVLQGMVREHPTWIAPFGVQVGINATGIYWQAWRGESDWLARREADDRILETLTGRRSENWSYAHRIDATIQLGLGHVRDASGVFQVRLLEARLRKDGRLSSSLSRETRHRLARLFYLSSGAYSVVHELPEKAFWRDVERILAESGALGPERFDAYDLLHSVEGVVVASGRFERFQGFFAGPVMEGDHRHDLSRYDSHSRVQRWRDGQALGETNQSFHGRSRPSSDDVRAGFALEWHRPIGIRAQFELRSTAVADIEGLDVHRSLESEASFEYLVGERWFFSARADHGRSIRDEGSGDDYWYAQGATGLRYYLEDRVSSSVTLDSTYSPGREGGRHRETELRLGMTYETGRASAPGLIEPLVPLH